MNRQRGFKLGVVLAGGGAYAAYEVGVMKAVFAGRSRSTNYTPVDPDLYAGSAVGGMNAAAIVAREELGPMGAVEALERLWVEQIADGSLPCSNGVYRVRGLPVEALRWRCVTRDPMTLVSSLASDAGFFARGSVSTVVDLLRPKGTFVSRVTEAVDLSSFVSIAPFESSLPIVVPLDGLRATTKHLRVVATNFNTGKVVVFTADDIREHGYDPLLAATAVPAFFPPHFIDGVPFIDGSSLMNTPLLPAIAEASTLHVIYMDPDLRHVAREKLDSTISVLDRALQVNFAHSVNGDIEFARDINRGLALIERHGRGERLTPVEIRRFMRVAARIHRRISEGRPYRPTTIHRYHPRDDLGEGLGLMNLDRDRLQRLIDRGYQDAVEHDCDESGCVLPGE